MTEQPQERYICECPECGRVADQDDEGMWSCAGGHSWTQPLAGPIKLIPADRERALERRAVDAERSLEDEKALSTGLSNRVAEMQAENEALMEALKEAKYRSGIAHATLRDAVYRIADQAERAKAETALARIAEINSLARAASALEESYPRRLKSIPRLVSSVGHSGHLGKPPHR